MNMSAIGMTSDQCRGPSTTSFTNAREHGSGNEPPKKRLTFAATATVQLIDCTATQEERSRYHHGRDELSRFSAEAKALASSARGAPGSDYVVRLDADPALRGMELRLFRDRAKHMAFGRRALIRYHTCLSGTARTDEEKIQSLAAASRRMSRWSRQVAAETARLDSLRAYYGDYLIPIGDPVVVEPHPCAAKRRRVTCDEEDRQRANAGASVGDRSTPIEASRASMAKRRRVSFDKDS